MTDIDWNGPFNTESVGSIIEAISDPIARNLTELCIGTILARFVRPDAVPRSEWEKQLPKAPIDMAFLAKALGDALSNREVVARIIAGEGFESAIGWDF